MDEEHLVKRMSKTRRLFVQWWVLIILLWTPYMTLYIHYSTVRRKGMSRMIMASVREWTTSNKYHTLNLSAVNLHGARSMGLMYTHVLQQHQIVRPCKFEFVRERRAVYSLIPRNIHNLTFVHEIWQQYNLQNHLIGGGRHFRLEHDYKYSAAREI